MIIELSNVIYDESKLLIICLNSMFTMILKAANKYLGYTYK